MIFPKGEIVHQNLSTEYTGVPELLSTLNSNSFAGIVEVELPGTKGFFFVNGGEVVSALIEEGDGRGQLAGQDAVQNLLVLSAESDGILNVYRLAPNQVEFVISTLKAEMIFRGLSTDFVRLDRFLQKLEGEKHTGFIDLFTKKNKLMGTLFLRDGELEDLYVPSESGDSSFFERQAIPTFLEDIIRQGGIFNVYKSAPNGFSKLETTLPTEELNEEQTVEACTEPTAGQADDTVPEVEVNGIAPEQAAEKNGDLRKEALLIVQEVLAKVEKFVDGFSHEGIFLRAFKRALIEESDTYPFLDPFADQFDYGEGRISLDDETEFEQFVVGIAESFSLTLSHLRKEFPKNMALPPKLKTDLDSLFQRYHDVVKRSGIEPVPVLFK
ncbi:MAG: hypothetical protein A4E65_03234 [Syntrophorhabdus sp. PtaU1.Bin153]|nr:MAG: hypothetical protein A4E65_03234 [Syntrophorhabdus sp. PtaU1.Bin153]